ncbi:MAG: ABC-ATPase domain-containing protein [Methanomassiliicoccales archaeon]|nr:ABC-ATPase domain-containing protein [Methanomassiliicoccales archaeon]NYT14503.1 ABC-ATPase domain-containing protein [Methanomassiliicoccales archaeon]
MKREIDLRNTLSRIDGRGYKAYLDIRGEYNFDLFTLIIDHVQGDPFATPSRVRVMVPQRLAGFPKETFAGKSRSIALRDFITRRFYESARQYSKGSRGMGKGGLIAIDRPGQEILERTSAFIDPGKVEVRFVMGLPAFGRRVAGTHAISMFMEELPSIVRASLLFESMNERALFQHIKAAEDADFLRDSLDGMGLVAFVADGAVLPRASGVDPRPLRTGNVVGFRSPRSLRMEVNLPNAGKVSGMGIPRGVTLIVGGGYHGKSTFLNALELGVYNHIPGDGRELVVTDPTAMKIRAEDGRRIEKTDISPFIDNLPFGRDTVQFSTEDASGSTSQAANIVESLEVGSSLLLIDEDTSATNFMIRDQRMQELVSKEKEPITPFVDKVRQLHSDLGVSTILVIGGSGDYFEVADRVICMIDYLPHDLTDEARNVAERYRTQRIQEGGDAYGSLTHRIPLARSFDPSKGRRDVKISSKGLQSITFGTHNIDLGEVEQLVDSSQTRAIGDAIYYAMGLMREHMTIKELVSRVMEDISKRGLDVLSERPVGDYALFRAQELAAAINRLRTLEVYQSHRG